MRTDCQIQAAKTPGITRQGKVITTRCENHLPNLSSLVLRPRAWQTSKHGRTKYFHYPCAQVRMRVMLQVIAKNLRTKAKAPVPPCVLAVLWKAASQASLPLLHAFSEAHPRIPSAACMCMCWLKYLNTCACCCCVGHVFLWSVPTMLHALLTY